MKNAYNITGTLNEKDPLVTQNPGTSSQSARQPLTPSEDRQWATLAHFGGFLGFVPSLVVFIVFRSRGPFTEQEAKEALNFTLPLTTVAVTVNILAFLPIMGAIFGVIAVLLWLFMTVSGVIAGIEVNKGRPYRYPFNLRIIR